ncbi:MAG: NTP transferase domain-containing protein [Candidatus Cloacimonetes bacterium]|nr:NTP transferase domain-containing protein [Candidatus Cloacimonadota bacterium]
MKAVIIAAGCGSRLQDYHHGIPKTLLEVLGKRIIDDILQKLLFRGISEIVIATGFKGNLIKDYLVQSPFAENITFVHNPNWKKANGISVLCSKIALKPSDTFLLMMSDHIFQLEILDDVIDFAIHDNEALLAIDRKIESIPDIDDGMKLQCTHLKDSVYRINRFSKQLNNFDAIDTGIFKFQYSFFSTLGNAITSGNDSLSDACNVLSKNHKMIGIDIGDKRWLDIDTPEMLNQERLLEEILNIS